MPEKKRKKRKKKKASPPDKYAILREELQSLPIRRVYPKLIAKLQMDEKDVGDAILRTLIMECPEDKRMAGYIYAVAKDDTERVKDWYTAKKGKWVETARKAIAEMKAEKEWHGAVYPSDLDEWIAANVPEWKEAKARLRDAEKIRDAARRLWESYENRLGSLQTYARLTDRHRGKSVAERNA